ncbi:hypothetical protein FM111_06135 [Brevundimonas diminuta 3F5N]|uniref:Uncharacterized protein n=1 Tax=Brevundimonas diminuta 3F5N TaxID=1255603 RepID=A0A1R4FPA1_BREDI|nr:hypothetical protein FM111_06135 [Brevundimonas diminuta 3F5N]
MKSSDQYRGHNQEQQCAGQGDAELEKREADLGHRIPCNAQPR